MGTSSGAAVRNPRTNLHLVGGKPETPKIPAEVRRSIHARLCLHGDKLRQVARSVGLDDNTTVQIVIAEIYEDRAKRIKDAWSMGYRAGLSRSAGVQIQTRRAA